MNKFVPLVACLLLVAGCGTGPKGSMGFTLPDGDPKTGKLLFTAFQCSSCHTIKGVDQPEAPELKVALGGETSRIQTYGELVTSIVNPSHKLAKKYAEELVSVDGVSRMRNYNDVMTVSQLIDLVAFVQSSYKLEAYKPTDYEHYRFDIGH